MPGGWAGQTGDAMRTTGTEPAEIAAEPGTASSRSHWCTPSSTHAMGRIGKAWYDIRAVLRVADATIPSSRI